MKDIKIKAMAYDDGMLRNFDFILLWASIEKYTIELDADRQILYLTWEN